MKKFISISIFLLGLFYYGATFADDEAFTAQRYKEIADEYRTQKQKLAAVDYYKKSLQKNSNFVPALVSMGTLMREFGSFEESRYYLLKAYNLNPTNLETIEELITTEMDVGDMNSAEEYLKKGMKEYPQEPDFDYLMARIYISRRQFYLAEKKLNQVIKNNPSHIRSLIALGDLKLEEKQFQAAYNAFEKARLVNSENPEVFIGLFKVSFYSVIEKEGRNFNNISSIRDEFNEAIDYLLNAREYDEDYVPANLLLGKLYTVFHECGSAKKYLDLVLKVSKDHPVAQYYIGLCSPAKSLGEYKTLLEKNQNNEVIRFSYERNLAKYSPRRENQELLEMAREHYEFGRNLFKAHMVNHGVFEMIWAAYLYPSLVEVHKELYQYYRSKKDFVKMTDELNYLRNVSEDVTYQDLYEMLLEKRKEKLYYREKIYRPEEKKTSTPLYIFDFYPENFLGNYPDAGSAIAEKLHIALQEIGRVRTLSASQKAGFFSESVPDASERIGIYYSPAMGRQVLKYMRKNFSTEDGYDTRFVRYAITGQYHELPEGLDVEAEIIDLETGITFASFHMKSTGRGYLRDIVTKLADNIYKEIPFQGQIIKISSNGVVINMGEREGIAKGTTLGVYRNGEKIVNLEVSVLDMDIVWAKPVNYTDLYRLQPGDKIRVEKEKDKKENPAQ